MYMVRHPASQLWQIWKCCESTDKKVFPLSRDRMLKRQGTRTLNHHPAKSRNYRCCGSTYNEDFNLSHDHVVKWSCSLVGWVLSPYITTLRTFDVIGVTEVHI